MLNKQKIYKYRLRIQKISIDIRQKYYKYIVLLYEIHRFVCVLGPYKENINIQFLSYKFAVLKFKSRHFRLTLERQSNLTRTKKKKYYFLYY